MKASWCIVVVVEVVAAKDQASMSDSTSLFLNRKKSKEKKGDDTITSFAKAT